MTSTITKPQVVLSGTVGSTAYGLSREGSDIDTLGVYVRPLREILSIGYLPHKDTKASNNPDATFHELSKFLSLVTKCNPTATELLWLPEDLYTHKSWVGERLIEARFKFLNTTGVRNAYGGYAFQQLVKLRRRGDSFDSDTKNRTAKHARHCMRLARQGKHLLQTGELFVRIDDPEEYWAFDTMTPEQMIEKLEAETTDFDTVPSVLPDHWDVAAANTLLYDIRMALEES